MSKQHSHLGSSMQARNDAPLVNPSSAFYRLTSAGSSFAWAWYCFMQLSMLALLVWTYVRVHIGRRTFHWIWTYIFTIASVHWFLKVSVQRRRSCREIDGVSRGWRSQTTTVNAAQRQASDLGQVPINILYHGPSFATNVRVFTRSIFYVQWTSYVLWGQLFMLLLVLPSGMPLSDILATLFINLLLNVLLLVASLIGSTYRYGVLVLSIGAWAWLLAHLLTVGSRSARSVGTDVRRAFSLNFAYWSFFSWVYFIMWGLGDGSNLISVNAGGERSSPSIIQRLHDRA